MIKPICKDPQILSQPSQPANLHDWPIAQDLLDTLVAHQKECVGLAANMIGINKQIIAISLGPINIAMLNPQITAKEYPYQTQEGCLSLIGQRTTMRYQEITLVYLDQTGHQQKLSLHGWAAQIVQHEIDHCHGIII